MAENSEEEIELTLGLSLNGKFGVDPIRTNNLKRSSSVINETTRFEVETTPWWGGEALERTCSLPVDVEEARRRKDLQTVRRREAKRRLSKKQRSCDGENEKTVVEREESMAGMASQRSSGSSGLSEVDSQTTPLLHGNLPFLFIYSSLQI
ncbi:hypothetical protein RND81_03G088800 [Saponaria officinalis]|uniref:Ninja-family protein n=1 Tax=Saponaria officinalis TaxID=3572 RepID=A0AAW1M931_SAPOF